MKTFRIKSNQYRATAIQFGSFLMNFNKNGISEVEVADDVKEKELENLVKSFSCISYLDEVENELLEAEKEKNIDYLQKIIDSKDKEIKALRISYEEIVSENTQLKGELKAYRQMSKGVGVTSPSTSVDTTSKVENKESSDKVEETKVNEETKVEDKTYKDLEKKTVAELKEILVEVFSEFENEWKPLTKKDDIIFYIVNKSENSK